MRITVKQLLGWFLLCCLWSQQLGAAESGLTYSTMAGTPGAVVNSADGMGAAAQFSAPRGLVVDGSGVVYVADSSNHTIRRVSSVGMVTTVAGTAGTPGRSDGVAATARFTEPFGVAVDGNGTLYVADTSNNAIRKITTAGVVSTLAGSGAKGSNDGTAAAARFSEPRGVALDQGGNLYVADYENHTIRKVTAAGVVTTLAGSAGVPGFMDGVGTSARFKSVQGLAVDQAGNIYVADAGNRSIRKVSPGGVVTTLANGSNGVLGDPRGVAVDSVGNVYVADYSAQVIHRVTAAGSISRFAGTAPTPGSTDGTTATALFNAPSGVAVDSANNVYVADSANNTVRKIDTSARVTTLAGMAGRTSSVDGVGAMARFQDPYALAVDGAGNVYVSDATDHSIRMIRADASVTTLAGKPGSFGSADGKGSSALFRNPLGIAVDTIGNIFIADTGNNTLRKIDATGLVTTLAGTAGSPGHTDGTGSDARFNSPYGVAADQAGNVYVIESSGVLRKISADGVVSTLAGATGGGGLIDGIGTAARFGVPFDLTVDSAGNIYVCDHGNHAIRKVTPAGVVTTLAGSGAFGRADGNGRSASFNFPSGIAVDSSGNLYVADTDNQVVRKVTPSGDVTTIGGSASGIGSADGIGTAARFYNPKDVAVDSSGNLYIADRSNHTIRKGISQSGSGVIPSDCLFDWAESQFRELFQPLAPPSLTVDRYYFRYYAQTQAYLAVAGNQLYYLGPVSANSAMDLGAVAGWYARAGCQ